MIKYRLQYEQLHWILVCPLQESVFLKTNVLKSLKISSGNNFTHFFSVISDVNRPQFSILCSTGFQDISLGGCQCSTLHVAN